MNLYSYEQNDYVEMNNENMKDIMNIAYNVCHKDYFDYEKFLSHAFNHYDNSSSDLQYIIDFFKNSGLSKEKFLLYMSKIYED